MLKNIVFDMGGVLVRFAPRVFIERLGIEGEDKERLLTEVFGGVEWIRLDRGNMTEKEAYDSVIKRLPEHLHEEAWKLISEWWKLPFIAVEGMADLIRELKGAGYRIYLLSNANPRQHEYFHRVPGSEHFDGTFTSADWQLLKPEHEIYEKFCSLYSLQPEECLFIDDMAPNVEAAMRTGMKGIVFHADVNRLRREMDMAGVRCPAHSIPHS